MNAYQIEQLGSQRLVRDRLAQMPLKNYLQIVDQVAPYLAFRNEVDRFLDRHCSGLCTLACFQSRLSACCSRDGIITFWADLVVNALCSERPSLDRLIAAIRSPWDGHKCIYLGEAGCLWRVRPLVCAMFLCDKVKDGLSADGKDLERQWTRLTQAAKGFRWPDRPVLFDALETVFIALGCQSPLMYLNTSPGLLNIKRKVGLRPSTAIRRP